MVYGVFTARSLALGHAGSEVGLAIGHHGPACGHLTAQDRCVTYRLSKNPGTSAFPIKTQGPVG